ncbi:MAG TPA: hypothetical protein VK961_20630 [Chthoniobacter sp.]|nr:hypothetical protein [Chthoniobacter sp.]
MGRLLETKVADIKDAELLGLIDELEEVCPVGSRNFVSSPMLHFLTQCVYPNGPEKRVVITTKFAASAPLLESRVGKLSDGPLRSLCGELASLAQSGLDAFNGSKVYVLLNKTLPRFASERSTARQKRWDSVIQQRRANRS